MKQIDNNKKYYGTVYYNNGDQYVGNIDHYDNGEGIGIYYWKNGDKYIGHWKNKESSGRGIIYFSDGTKFIGMFKNDQKCKNSGVYILSNIVENHENSKDLEFLIGGSRYDFPL